MAAIDQELHFATVAVADSEKARLEQKRETDFWKYRVLPAEKKLSRNIRELGLSENQMEQFSVFVPWDNSFCVPRKVWQSAVLVYISKAERDQGWGKYLPCQIDVNGCLGWLRRVFEVRTQVKDGDAIAVWKYFKHLEAKGILRHLTRREFDLLISSAKWPYCSHQPLNQG